MLDIVCWGVFPGAMAFAGSFDLFTMTIPNRVTLFLVAGFFVLAPLAGLGLEQFAWHLVAGLSMLALGVGFWSRGWVGGGDAKIFAAAALWLGFDYLSTFAIVSVLAGGLLTLGLLTARRIPLPGFLLRYDWLVRLHDHKTGVPYGIAFAFGALWVYPMTPWAKAFAF